MSLCSCDPDKEFNFDCYSHGPNHKLRARVKELQIILDSRHLYETKVIQENAALRKVSDAAWELRSTGQSLTDSVAIKLWQALDSITTNAVKESE